MSSQDYSCSTLGTVVVVDDSAAVRDSLKFVLELEGLTVHTYSNGPSLLAKRWFPPIGCLVVDYYMPLMNGIELVEILRSRDIVLPTILITAKVTPRIRHHARIAGVLKVLEKPLDDASLIDSIQFALSKSHT